MEKISWLALCALLGAAVLTGCGAGEREPFEEKTYTAQAEQVREVRLDVRDRSIEVSASEDGQIHIGCAENSKEYYEIGVSEDGVLEMTAASDKSWTDYIGGKAAAGSRKITLRLPQAQLSALALSTTNENVTFSDHRLRERRRYSVRLPRCGGKARFAGEERRHQRHGGGQPERLRGDLRRQEG